MTGNHNARCDDRTLYLAPLQDNRHTHNSYPLVAEYMTTYLHTTTHTMPTSPHAHYTTGEGCRLRYDRLMALLAAASGQEGKLFRSQDEINDIADQLIGIRDKRRRGWQAWTEQPSKLQLLQVLCEGPRNAAGAWVELCWKGKAGVVEGGAGGRGSLEGVVRQQVAAVGRAARKLAEEHKVKGAGWGDGVGCGGWDGGGGESCTEASKGTQRTRGQAALRYKGLKDGL